MNTVSICIPVFNGQEFLDASLAAVRSQTHPDLKILISVDLSDDNSLAICKRFQCMDKRITVFPQDERLGFVENINFLIRRTQTKFFCLVPQDDLLSADYISALLQPMLCNDRATLVYSDMNRGPSTPTEFQGSLLGGKSKRIFGYLTRQVNHVEWRGLIRRSCVDESFHFGAGQNIDQALPLKLALHGELIRVPRLLYHKTMHPGSAVDHQRGNEMGRFQRVGDSFVSCLFCYERAMDELNQDGLRQLAKIALVLRYLNVAEINWPFHDPGTPSGTETRIFGGLLNQRIRDTLLSHDCLRELSVLEHRYPGEFAILKGGSMFHLALVAEHFKQKDHARFLMRTAVEVDPELHYSDEFHQSSCNRILGF